jgi:non-heme chloroperoxidase
MSMRSAGVAMVAMLSVAAFGSVSVRAQSKDAVAKVEYVTVQPGVRLEVLDWGGPPAHGPGSALVFLAGLGETSHAFDKFAPQFAAHYHVYGITRRGFGASSKPAPTVDNYSAQRLGEDVLAVIASLHLDRPVLVGHSIAGEELSWIGSVHPEKASGLIYLDAAQGYAWYANERSDWQVAMANLWQRLDALRKGGPLNEYVVEGMLQSTTQFRDDLEPLQKEVAKMPRNSPPPPPVALAVMFGQQEFTAIHVPALAIFACPHSVGSLVGFTQDRTELIREDKLRCTAQADSFQKGNPGDTVVRIAHADHVVFKSNPKLVEQAIESFLEKLK